MRIGFNCRSFLKKNPTGIGRYARNLIHTLKDIDTSNQYVLYVRKGLFDFSRQTPRIRAKNFRVRHDWFNRGPGSSLKNIDIYHTPSPDYLSIDGAKVIVTVHDVIHKSYPQGHTTQTLEALEKQFKDICTKAHKIICISQTTRDDMCRFYHIDAAKTAVIYQGVDKDLFYPLGIEERRQAAEDLEKIGLDGPFILFVGTIEPRKNLRNLLKAFAQLKGQYGVSRHLVVAGMKGWMTQDIQGLLKGLKIEHDVIFTGYVPDDQLRKLYNLCDVFVYPSFYEGFGYPIMEAFSCGACVVTSHDSSCGEIAKEAAFLIDPHDVNQIAKALQQTLEDKDLNTELRQKGLKRAKDFSFVKNAQETLKVYEEVHAS